MPTLSPATLAAVRRAWAARLRVDEETFEAPGIVLVERDELDAVVVVALGETSVAAGPGSALDSLAPLDRRELVDLACLLTALRAHAPAPIGATTLSYADADTAASPPDLASEDDCLRVLALCSDADRDESGLREMPFRFVVRDDGCPVALAGYELWNHELAHVGVLTVPGSRGHGLARAAARAAISHASGLVPQWRASVDNAASTALADRLGFVRAGLQVAVDVSPSRPGPG